MNRPDDLSKYVRVLVLYLVGTTIAVAVARVVTDSTLTGVSFIMPAVSMWAAIGEFVEDHGRLPDDAERRRLMKVGMLVTTVITLVGLFGIGLSMNLGTGAMAAILLFCLLVNWASLRTGIWMTRNLPTNARRPRR